MARYFAGLLVTCVALIGVVMVIGGVAYGDGWMLVVGLVLASAAWGYIERHPSET